MFQDEVKIKVIAGKGGDGCTSFRREKFVEMGGPNGGNGGKGASIIFKTDPGLRTLIDLHMMKQIKGDKGTNGKGSNRNGANTEDVYISVPMGTTIYDDENNIVLADLTKENEEYVVARGGRGGRGNRAFATHDNPAPRMSELGEPGESLIVRCELKVLADVGLVGMPSVGKSTLISNVSNCNAKIGAYHFTTLSPNLGVVRARNGKTFVMADLPGLIEGAHEGVGLGDKFLRHAMRTKVIAHVLDMGGSEGRNPLEDYEIIKNELSLYDETLKNKPYIIIANKMDLENAKDNLARFKEKYPDEKIFEISALNKEGLNDLIDYLQELVEKCDEVILYDENQLKESHVLYKFKNEKPFTVKRENNIWILSGHDIETLFYMTRFDEDESVERFGRKLRGMGVEDELERMGAKRGDEVKILDYIFIFKE
ncbi:gTPase obg [Firmicutes bacterium CAG:582]|nr:GTPase ObgE [bacterium]CDB28602.1 gTPase obg [Firmicutes bacterium CAG:582]